MPSRPWCGPSGAETPPPCHPPQDRAALPARDVAPFLAGRAVPALAPLAAQQDPAQRQPGGKALRAAALLADVQRDLVHRKQVGRQAGPGLGESGSEGAICTACEALALSSMLISSPCPAQFTSPLFSPRSPTCARCTAAPPSS